MSEAITNLDQKNKRDQKNKNKQDQYYEDIKEILSRPSGVRFFKSLFEYGFIYQTSFTGNSQTFFNEGHRNFALKFFNEICIASPDKLPELIIRKPDFDDNAEDEN